ncbi:MAG: cytochrome b/b6 domain-containing protein [Hyphomicrobiales bacterium]
MTIGRDGRKAAQPVDTIAVWDRLIRLFHWSLVATVAVAMVSGFLLPENWLNLHLVAGAAIALLLVLRLAWGIAGSSHARFSAFLYAPARTLDYLRAHIGHRAPHYRGHNPLGALMVFALLAVLAALVLSGVIALGGVEKRGPLAFITSFAAGSVVRELHEILAFALLGLVAAHVAGVVLSSLAERINLAGAMVTGRKPALVPADHPRPATARTVPALAFVALVGGVGAAGTMAFASLPGRGVPQAPLDPVYRTECGDCHIAFHPSLAGAAEWQSMLKGLDRHFGEDATLPPETVNRLATYLLANSATEYDTKAANWFRRRDPADPLRITATPFWKRRHAGIDDGTFADLKVGARGACGACHGDAGTGRFDDAAIAIPDLSKQ